MNLNITGDKNIDKWLKLGLFMGAGYLGYKLITNLSQKFTPPINPTPSIPELPGCNLPPLRKNQIGQQMDQISSLLTGYNVYNYPDEVNVILGYNSCEIHFANDYYKQTYGQTLYSVISGEWDIDGDYDSAENKLQSFGLGF